MAPSTPYDNYEFAPIRESQISRAMTSRHAADFPAFLHPSCTRPTPHISFVCTTCS